MEEVFFLDMQYFLICKDFRKKTTYILDMHEF